MNKITYLPYPTLIITGGSDVGKSIITLSCLAALPVCMFRVYFNCKGYSDIRSLLIALYYEVLYALYHIYL